MVTSNCIAITSNWSPAFVFIRMGPKIAAFLEKPNIFHTVVRLHNISVKMFENLTLHETIRLLYFLGHMVSNCNLNRKI